MPVIPDSLRLLYEAELEDRGDEYVVSIPKGAVANSVDAGDVFRVALLDAPTDAAESATEAETDEEPTARSADARSSSVRQSRDPPVEEGSVRSVTIDTLGDQGDGIAKVERGFIVIVPGTQPGDRVDVEITDVKDSVAFAEPVSEPEVI
ncbi:TRAM domain-containing protein [Halobacterium sp. R2-5]|uniref:TRAM domain-containing protein n=1 Tax=Halobacterium sp. R2-5 TaxID=2715751 RepID=UPI001422FCEF|nr:TRAM domain-containing protein [Halobacterium sp. R2-5]NIC00735.1 TRAM domain-containing protein [Halobacterium sp. R2-5]